MRTQRKNKKLDLFKAVVYIDKSSKFEIIFLKGLLSSIRAIRVQSYHIIPLYHCCVPGEVSVMVSLAGRYVVYTPGK